MTGVRQVENRWGVIFWKLIADFADQGLSRFDTARAIGYRPDSFCALLGRHPEHDPFEDSVIALAYLKDTGETMRQALERMAEEGQSWGYAARQIGYADSTGLKRAAEARGIQVELKSTIGRPRTHVKRRSEDRLNVTTSWPTWEKVYEMTSPPLSQQRKKKKHGSV